ncbi:MAG: hypothetical protein H0V83_01310 [Rubrobacter sp.]|nr:hypothetical protein [Rubrobacter sp.]
MKRVGLVRAGLLFLVVASLIVGPWAQFAPHSFWEGFPGFGRAWVSADGPYNEHLVRDVGGLQLAMVVLLLAAFIRPEVVLVRVAALASIVWQAPHLVYHLVHVGDLPTLSDMVIQSVGLVFTFAVALAVLVMARGSASGASSELRRRVV